MESSWNNFYQITQVITHIYEILSETPGSLIQLKLAVSSIDKYYTYTVFKANSCDNSMIIFSHHQSYYGNANIGKSNSLTMIRGGGDTALEAGASVICDQCVCCIDEFDEMGNQHALLDAME